MPGEFFFFGIGSIVGNLVFSVLVVVVAVAVGTARGEPDPRGNRLRATYLCVVLFFSLFTALFAATAAMGSLMDLTRSDDESAYDFEDAPDFEGGPGFGTGGGFDDAEPYTDHDTAADLVATLFVAAAAGGVLLYHRRQMLDLAEEDDFVGSGAATAFSAYLYVSQLVALVALVLGVAMALSGLVQVVAPGTFSVDDADLAREDGAREAFVGAFLTLASLAIFVLHQRERVLVEPDDDEPATDEEPIA